MISTTTIARLCISEDRHPDHEARAAQFVSALELADSQSMTVAIEAVQNLLDGQHLQHLLAAYDYLQLACEAIKFHRLRQSGLDLDQAMAGMFA